MCGIAGIFSNTQWFSEQEIRKMVDALQHRGHDAEGVYVNDNVALGHQRLSKKKRKR